MFVCRPLCASKLPAKDRFNYSYVVNNITNCWEWQFDKDRYGYGRIKILTKRYSAHRASWEFKFGPIQNGLFVLHSCDNKKCVNPAHLFLGTQKDNMVDYFNKKGYNQTERVNKELIKKKEIKIKKFKNIIKKIKFKGSEPKCIKGTFKCIACNIKINGLLCEKEWCKKVNKKIYDWYNILESGVI